MGRKRKRRQPDGDSLGSDHPPGSNASLRQSQWVAFLSLPSLTRFILPYPSMATASLLADALGCKSGLIQAKATRIRHRRGAAAPSFFYFLYNKPAGVVCSRGTEKFGGERTASKVYDRLPIGYPPVPPVGRLDLDTDGLLIFTDDGALGGALISGEHEAEVPSSHSVKKVYVVCVEGLHWTPDDREWAKALPNGDVPRGESTSRTSTAERLSRLREPLLYGREERETRPASVRVLDSGTPATVSTTLEFTLEEGKNRQIRRLCERSALIVLSLCRVQLDTLTLEGVPVGDARPLTTQEVHTLYARHQLNHLPLPTVLPLPCGTDELPNIPKETIKSAVTDFNSREMKTYDRETCMWEDELGSACTGI